MAGRRSTRCGTREDADNEKAHLAAFLKDELRLELSEEKTLVTRAEDGFQFLGYKVIKEMSRKGRLSGNLRIPKGKLQDIRQRIKQKTTRSTTGRSLADLLDGINPLITGWRNYYRYATGAWKDFQGLDWWLWERVRLWLNKKHRKCSSHEIRRQYIRRGTRRTWHENGTELRRFSKGGTAKYRCRGVNISNGWNDEMDGFLKYGEANQAIFAFIQTANAR